MGKNLIDLAGGISLKGTQITQEDLQSTYLVKKYCASDCHDCNDCSECGGGDCSDCDCTDCQIDR